MKILKLKEKFQIEIFGKKDLLKVQEFELTTNPGSLTYGDIIKDLETLYALDTVCFSSDLLHELKYDSKNSFFGEKYGYKDNLYFLKKGFWLIDGCANFDYDEKEIDYTFTVRRNITDELGITHISFNLSYNSLPVFTEQLLLDFRKNEVTANDVDLIDINLSKIPKVSKLEAKKIIESEQVGLRGVEPQLGYYDKNASTGNNSKDYALVWKAEKGAQVVLDANTGDILYSFDGMYD